MGKKRTRIEATTCPNCGAPLEVREDLAHGVLRCPHCESGSNVFIEETNEEEREYDALGKLKREKIKYPKGGAFSKRVPFLPTTKFGKVPQEYDEAFMRYTDLKGALSYIDNIKGIEDIDEIKKSHFLMKTLVHKMDYSVERVGGKNDYGDFGKDAFMVARCLAEAGKYSQWRNESLDPSERKIAKEYADEALGVARMYKDSLLERITQRESQLAGNQKEYESRLGPYRVAAAILAIGSFIFVLAFSYFNLTGFVILQTPTFNSGIIGIIIFIVGLIGAFFWFRSKKVKKSISKKKRKK